MHQFGSFKRASIGPERLPQLADGFEGVLLVEKTFVEDTRFGDKFFCEFTVMSTNREAANPVGQRCIWKQDLTKKDVADNSLLEWGAAVLGVDREDESTVEALKDQFGDLINYAVNANNEQNNFTKRYVVARAYEKKTQNGRDFLAVNFAPYRG
jgi:hypothetical protein